jgi:hypothetical protein
MARRPLQVSIADPGSPVRLGLAHAQQMTLRPAGPY